MLKDDTFEERYRGARIRDAATAFLRQKPRKTRIDHARSV